MKKNNKIALITGVGREEGIGFGVAKTMAEKGFEVIVTARVREKAETISKKISSSVVAEKLDIEDETSVKKLIEFVNERYKRLDILINNAGAGFDMGVQPLETDLNE